MAEETTEDGAVFEGRVGPLREVRKHWVAGIAAVAWLERIIYGKGGKTYTKTRVEDGLIQVSISASAVISLGSH